MEMRSRSRRLKTLYLKNADVPVRPGILQPASFEAGAFRRCVRKPSSRSDRNELLRINSGLFLCSWRGGAPGQNLFHMLMRTRNDVHGNELADAAGGGCAGVRRGL